MKNLTKNFFGYPKSQLVFLYLFWNFYADSERESSQEKEARDWQQSIPTAQYLITKKYTKKNKIVVWSMEKSFLLYFSYDM